MKCHNLYVKASGVSVNNKLINFKLAVLGWKRQNCRFRNYGRRSIFYLSPCGRRCRNMDEVHRCVALLHNSFIFNYEVTIYSVLA